MKDVYAFTVLAFVFKNFCCMDLPSEVPSPGECSGSTETSEACSSPPEREESSQETEPETYNQQEREESSQETEPETYNQQEREESSQKTKPKTSKASETEPELVVESSCLVEPTPENVLPTDTSSAEEIGSRYINAIAQFLQQFWMFIKYDMIWSGFLGFLTLLASVCFALAGVFVTFAVTFLCTGFSLLVTVLTACGVRFANFRRNIQSSTSEQMLLEGGLRQSPDIRAPVTQQPSSIHGSSSQFPWPVNTTDTVRGMFGRLSPRQEELGGEQQSRRTRTYEDVPESEGIFERDVAASGSSVELLERDVASSSSLGLFERDVASSPSFGLCEGDLASSSSSCSSNVMVVEVEVHREESSEDIVEEKPESPRGSDEPEFESTDF